MDLNQSFIGNASLKNEFSPGNSLCVLLSLSMPNWIMDVSVVKWNESSDGGMVEYDQFDIGSEEGLSDMVNVQQKRMSEMDLLLDGNTVIVDNFLFNGTINLTEKIRLPNFKLQESKYITCMTLRSRMWMVDFHNIYSYCCVVAICIGNILVLVLPLVEKTFRNPVFITLQSLSVTSILYGTLLLIKGLLSINCLDIPNLQLCVIVNGLLSFTLNVYLHHLSILASQRIYMTLFPLKALVHHTKKNVRFVLVAAYLVAFIYQLIMYALGVTSCTQNKLIENNLEPIIIHGLTSTFVITALVVSSIKARVSKNLQNGSQRKQSRLASIVIMIYMFLYWPSVCVYHFLINSCDGSMLFIDLVHLFNGTFKLFVLCINPIILCLRTKEARTALMSCKCKA